jgi:hypothetical protein
VALGSGGSGAAGALRDARPGEIRSRLEPGKIGRWGKQVAVVAVAAKHGDLEELLAVRVGEGRLQASRDEEVNTEQGYCTTHVQSGKQ